MHRSWDWSVCWDSAFWADTNGDEGKGFWLHKKTERAECGKKIVWGRIEEERAERGKKGLSPIDNGKKEKKKDRHPMDPNTEDREDRAGDEEEDRAKDSGSSKRTRIHGASLPCPPQGVVHRNEGGRVETEEEK